MFLVQKLVPLFFFFIVCSAKESYEGYQMLRLFPTTSEQVEWLHDLWLNDVSTEYDFWHPPSNPGSPVDLSVGPETLTHFKEQLENKHIRVQVKIQNLAEAIRNESRENTASFAFKSAFLDAGSYDVTKYHRFDVMMQHLRDLSKKYPDIVKLMKIGKTHENRDMTVVKIGKPSGSSNKPAIWLDGGIHAREWISPATVMYFVKKLVENYNLDDNIRRLVDKIDWYLLPVHNPDGYEFTHTEKRMWRKNRNPNGCSSRWSFRKCCKGVDLNRNYEFKWASAGSSSSPCSNIFHGSAAFSEPESRAVRDFVSARTNQLKAFITIHSYGQIWMYPYGHRRRTYPSDKNELEALAKNATKALQSVHGTHYSIGTGADTMYAAAGGSDDWAKGQAKIKFVYLLELRPDDNGWGNGFILDEKHIVPTASETWKGIEEVANEIIQRYSITATTLKPAPVLPVVDNENQEKSSSKPAPIEPTTTRRPTSTTAKAACADLYYTNCIYARFFGYCYRPDIRKKCPKSCDDC